MNTSILIVLAALIAVMNMVSFCLMAFDKRRAQQGKWRVPERTLFLVAGLFGAIGGTIGMHVYHHKTNHWNFRAFFPTMMIIQIAVLRFPAIKTFA